MHNRKRKKAGIVLFRIRSLASVFVVGELSFLFIFHFFHLDFLIHVFITVAVSVFLLTGGYRSRSLKNFHFVRGNFNAIRQREIFDQEFHNDS